MSDPALSPKSNPDFFEAVGAAVVTWSRLEALLGIAILKLSGIRGGSGLLLTSNIGFKGLVSILTIKLDALAPEIADPLRTVLKSIERSYVDRNWIVHGVWDATEDPALVMRTRIRASNRKISQERELFPVSKIGRMAETFGALGRELSELLDAHTPPLT